MNAPAAQAHWDRAGRTARNGIVGPAARAGLTARGVIHLIVGALALQIAFGDGHREADSSGAVAELAGKPFGEALLWALGAGLAGMAVWQLSEALFGAAGPDGRTARARLTSAARCVFYAASAFSVLAFAAGSRSHGSRSSDRQSHDLTSRVLDLPAGQVLVGAAGAGIVVAGVWMGVQAVRRTYREQLRLAGMSRGARALTDVTGVAGGVARGVLFAGIGAFAVRAAVVHRPGEARGVDGTLRSFAGTPLGPWLLAAVATGLVLFGVFSFLLARRRRV
ncbi:DUF1206 domain-containing protein [Streptomyces thermocoprophilus]|uniref:DUF1206 domain-containing protein n=1 Tax=Streptomyces thermocoprophilus TaxID=78356 RepID=A0ABV5VM68_9ACTN